MKTKRFHAWGLLLAGLFCFPTAQATVTLQLEVQTHVEPKPDSKNAPKDSTILWEVVLADKAMLVKSDKESNLFDFDKRRRIVLDNINKTQVSYSLYDTAGFRLYELQNREAIGKMLATAKIGQVAMPAIDNEHLLAIQAKPSSPFKTSLNGTVEDLPCTDSKVSDTVTSELTRYLLEKYGPVIGVDKIWQVLEYKTKAAFERSFRRGRINVPLFRIPGREGMYALAPTLAVAIVELSAAGRIQHTDTAAEL